ncbi:AAA family ATPase [Natrialbaceae archaeon A-CW1-1]
MSSTADADDVVEVQAGGITVTKTYTAEEFPVPAIRFEIETTTDDVATVRLSEDIPESFPMDSVGFHPEYHSDQWTAFQDNHVEFTGEIDPAEPLVTVYGIRLDDDTDPASFLTEPTITVVDSNDDETVEADGDHLEDTMIEDIIADDSNQVVKDMLSGESDGVPGLADNEDEEDDTDAADDAGETADADETTAEADTTDTDLEYDEADLEGEADTGADDAEDDDTEDEEVGLESGEEADADEESFLGQEELDLNLEDVETDPEPVDDADEDEAETPDIDLGFEDDEIPTADDKAVDEKAPPTIELDLEGEGEGEDEEAATDDADEVADDADEITDDADEPPKIELDLEEAASSADTAAKSASADADDGVEASETPTADGDTAATGGDRPALGARLAAEIREGDLSDADLETLRDALDVEGDTGGDSGATETGLSGSDQAKIDHLQSRVDELAAYTSALESFLDDNGTGEQLIEEFRTQVSTFEGDLATVEEQLDETVDTVEANATAVEAVDDRTETLESDLEDVSESVTDVESALEDVESDVDSLETDLGDVADDVEDLGVDLGSLEGHVDDIEADMGSLEDDVDDLEADLEDVSADVTDLTEWRDQLGSMFSE